MSEANAVMPTVRVTRLQAIKTQTNGIRAFADVLIGEHYAVRGIRVMEGPKGLFVSMPGRQVGDGAYIDTFRPITKEARELLHALVLAAYKLGIKGNGGGVEQ